MSAERLSYWSRLALLAVLVVSALVIPSTPQALAQTPTQPASVTIAGSLQSELGCPGDWDPACANTFLDLDAEDGIWRKSFAVPAGNWEYKAALNGSWDESYGLNTGPDNIKLDLTTPQSVKFYYDRATNWVTSNANARIVTAAGSFQSELGCPGDWQPDCLRSWLQDPDGDGVYTFTTAALPAGSYEGKAPINEAWDENYGAGGVRDGANIGFTVPADGVAMLFSFVSATNTLTIRPAGASFPDGNVEWDGLRHDSRDTLYRTPGGAVPAGTPVTVRFRTFHNDVTGVSLRVYDVNANAQSFVPMALEASDVDCYQDGLAGRSCDFWSATVERAQPNNLWYRFVVSDGADSDYYADNTGALDGGLGAASDDPIDQSFALMFHAPAFSSPNWAKTAVIYQIFPDRFRNGEDDNDPRDGDIRYDDPVIKLDWGTLPEGYCRNYSDATTGCPWRFDTTPPETSPTKEQPRGRDYFGGDLEGVTDKLEYLKQLGVTVIYFNPIFAAGSNHRYDTRDYYTIDPYLGDNEDFKELVEEAREYGIRVVLDSVFNHMSSDSPLFDRYSHYPTLGACESLASPYRSWFNFRNQNVPCGSADYVGWFGFDSIPEIDKNNPAVLDYFVTGRKSVSRYWLGQGAAGWRLDVMGDPSFPAGYWEQFRQVTRQTRSDSLIIGELWQKDSTLLRHMRGQTADTTMNYRLRDAVLGLLAPGGFDSKGFADSGRVISPSEFANRVQSIREDYPDAAYYTLMNLLGSHDTERILWTLTPGAETIADKELNAANLAAGKSRLRLASLIQFTMPGAPTVYYGDEVGVTGDDDPDDRRTYPWRDEGGKPDTSLFNHYRDLTRLRDRSAELARGDLKVLLADDAAQVVAYGRRHNDLASLVLVNRGSAPQSVSVPVAGYLPNGVLLQRTLSVGGGATTTYTVTNGAVAVTLPPLSGVVLRARGFDLTAPAAPAALQVADEGDRQIGLSWGAVSGAAGYNVYRSPVSGGGWVKLTASPVAGTSFVDSAVTNGRTYYYAVTALDAAGNESAPSGEVAALPHYRIGWANLQWPPAMSHTISVTDPTDTVYGQVWIDGVTNAAGATPSLIAELGFGPDGSDPAGAGWTWVEATFNVNAGNNDEFKAELRPEAVGQFDYAYRYSTTGGRDWVYADLDGIGNGYSPDQAGALTVVASADTVAPATPSGLAVESASPAGIVLSWTPVSGDDSLYGYEVLRSATAGGPYTQIARVTGAGYTDVAVDQGATYYYVVRALDGSFNRSGNSAEVSATAELRSVSLVFNVTVPASTDATGSNVHIAGFLDRLDPLVPGVNNPQWDPAGIELTRVSATNWRITFTGKEGTQIEYKFTLGSWDFVEKDTACGEIANRQLTLAYGATGTQQVDLTVDNWRNVAPCGN